MPNARAKRRVSTIEVPDVRAIREQLGLSQHAFASAHLVVIAHLPIQARDALRVA